MTKRKGRPSGSTTKSVPIVPVEPSRCPQCGSTDRTEYINRREFEHAGEHDGHPYNRVVWRRTSCKQCGQGRDDRTLEYVPAP